MTHHAAALTYYSLMSLFPAMLLGLSLLGLVGQYPATYDAILGYLREVVPSSLLQPLDSSLRNALQAKGTAATTLVVSAVLALYGTTGVLEAARRALNVVFEVSNGRSFLRRKTVDVLSTVVLGALILTSLVLVFVGGGFAEDLLGFAGLGEDAARAWNYARWPARGADRDPRVLVPVLRDPGRPAPILPLGHARGRDRGDALGAGLVRLLALPDAGRRRGRDLRRLRRRDRARRLAVAHERRVVVRGRAQRRARAREGARPRACRRATPSTDPSAPGTEARRAAAANSLGS